MDLRIKAKSLEGIEFELCLYTLKGLADKHKDITSYDTLRRLTMKIAKGEHPPEWEGYRIIGKPRCVWLAYQPIPGLKVNLDPDLFNGMDDLPSD